jgi:opacity protein-like surface antigen
MRSLVLAAVTLAALCGARAALAQEGGYSGLSYVWVSYERDGFPSADPQALAFRLGARIHRHLALEARAGFGVGEDTVSFQGVPVEVRIDHYFGVYGKAIAPLSASFSVYGLAGLVGGKVTAKGLGYSASSSDTGLSLGVGVDLSLGRRLALSFEWAELFKDADFKVEATSVGFLYRH